MRTAQRAQKYLENRPQWSEPTSERALVRKRPHPATELYQGTGSKGAIQPPKPTRRRRGLALADQPLAPVNGTQVDTNVIVVGEGLTARILDSAGNVLWQGASADALAQAWKVRPGILSVQTRGVFE